MKLLFAFLGLILGGNVFAQETNVIMDPNAKPRILNASFSEINVSDGIEVHLSQAQDESIAVSYSDEKYAGRFKTVVEKGVLRIYYDRSSINWNDNNRRKLKAYVSFKTLEKITASGGADVQLQSEASFTKLAIKLSSGSFFKGQVKAQQIAVDQNSGSSMVLSGTAEKIVIEASSGAVFKGFDLAVDYCDADVSSGGGVRISVQKELTAKASSGGGIHYKGSAVIRDIDISSGGIVKKA